MPSVTTIYPSLRQNDGEVVTPGTPISLSVGTVTTAVAGSDAEVTVTGVAPGQILNFTIPRGADGPTDLTFETRAAVAAATIESTVGGIYTQGYSTAGDGGGALYVRAATEPTHGAKIQSADGAWWELAEQRPNLFMFGAVADDATDCFGAWTMALDYLKSKPVVQNSQFQGSRRLIIPAGAFYSSQTWDIKGLTLILEGEGVGGVGGVPTRVRWAASTTGIIVSRNDTEGAGSGTGRGGDASIIRGMYLMGGGGTGAYNGIQLRARATAEEIVVGGFAQDGINIVAVAGGSDPATKGNANNWQLRNIRTSGNGRAGVFVDGPDANAGTGHNVDASNNANYGIYDSSFLGNLWSGCHSDANGVKTAGLSGGDGLTSQVYHLAKSWFVMPGKAALASTTEPGTDATVWGYLNTSGGAGGNLPEWVSGIGTKEGAAYFSDDPNAASVFAACYSEGGQPPSHINTPCVIIGGLHGASIRGTAPFLVGSSSSLRTDKAFSSIAYNDDRSLSGIVAFGGAYSLGEILSVFHTTEAPNSWRLKRVSGDLLWDYNNQGSARSFYITGPSTARTYGRSSILPHSFQADRLIIGEGPTNGRRLTNGAAAPTTGDWAWGDVCFHVNPVLGGPAGWRCVTAGSPGTWEAFGNGAGLENTAVYDPPSLIAGAADTIQTMIVTGAALGDFADISFSLDLQGLSLRAWVSAANVVSYQFTNPTAGVLDLASGNVKCRVRK